MESRYFFLHMARIDAFNGHFPNVAYTWECKEKNLVLTYVVLGTPPFDIQSHILRIVFRRAIMFDIESVPKDSIPMWI